MNGLGRAPWAVIDGAPQPDDFNRRRHPTVKAEGDGGRGRGRGPWVSGRTLRNRERKRVLRRNDLDLSEQGRERQQNEHHESHRARPLTASNAASSPSPVTTPLR